MAENALVVPVDVEALVVNDAILRRDGFRWWQYNYLALKQYRSPEPVAGDRSVGSQVPGVYLSWTLPQALRSGTQDPATGEVSYPLVPNRWLILRLSGGQPRKAAGWVLESDCPFTSRVTQVGVERTSMYLPDAAVIQAWKASADPYRSGVTLDPRSAEPQVANLGIPFPADGWAERYPGPQFLSAVAPGNPSFGAYVPHNFGVFTFIDDLRDLSPAGPQPLSYLVAGWYSDPAADILASWPSDSSASPYQALLQRLGWTVAGPPNAPPATRSYYTGTALTVGWDPAAPPAADPLVAARDSGQLDVALGNTAEDAFITLAGHRLATAGHPASAVGQLRAFLYGLLPLVNQPNGDAALQRAIAARWFGAHAGGSRWAVTADDAAGREAAPGPEPAPPGWLDQLNSDQRQLDTDVAALRAGQWDLNAMWWKKGRYPYDSFPDPPSGVDSIGLLTAQLDPGTSGTLAARVVAALQRVLAGTPAVPQPTPGAGTPEDALERGIAAFATGRGLPAGQVLKAVPAEPYWQPANPVLMLSGVEASQEAGAGAAAEVRPGGQLISALHAGGRDITAAAARSALAAQPALGGLPDLAWPIVTECLLVDPGSAAALGAAAGVAADVVRQAITGHPPANYAGLPPAVGLADWAQPWRPLFAEWQVSYTDLPQAPGVWAFDGTDYRCGSAARAGTARTISGISLIGPHASTVFRARLAEFVTQYGAEGDLAQLDGWIEQVAGWRFLSQELTGFHQLLTNRDDRPFRRPAPSDTIGTAHPYPLADLLGYPGAGGTPGSLADRYRGAVTSVPYLPAGTDTPFFGVRQGQVEFVGLILYDRFGRVLPLIQPGPGSGLYNPDNFPLTVDPALAPQVTILPRVAAPAQLPPRVLQPARLEFALLDAATGTDSDLMAAANPIGGWILANHLDQSLLLYAAGGAALGEVRVVANSAGTKSCAWTPPPHSSVATLADVARLAPLVAGLIGAPPLTTPAGFAAFLQVIDTTLWSTDPLGARADQNLSVLIGRPLALVRARVGVQLDGPPVTDCGWAATLDPPAPGFLSQDFAIRLGDQATRDDGLIGYITAGQPGLFNSVAAPADPAGAAAAGLRQVGAPLADGTPNYLWRRCGAATGSAAEVIMVLDPRGSVHAITGILPARSVAVRPDLVSRALAGLEVSFQVGATLTTILPTDTPAGQQPPYPLSVAFPPPAENQGAWSWWQPGPVAGTWTGYAVADPGTGAALRPAQNLLADGVLQYVVDLTKGITG